MTFEEFNAADIAVARAALLPCCGSTLWVEEMLARWPFPDPETLLSTADAVWWTLGPSDWLEAFSAHPRIGEKKLSGWCSQEQSEVNSVSDRLLEQLVKGNHDYQQRFGWIFLVNATGKTAAEMLDLLQARLNNDPAKELRVAAGEQANITTLRLHKLLDV